ncbi:MAG: hypothetical protein HYS12_29585 [Planctomycetes bacterium]|nr:hypothetical protein [Planctomycetota bacterium]
MSAEPVRGEGSSDGVRFYAVMALLALLAASFPLLLRGLELWALLPSLLGALALAARWPIGPVLYLLGLFWLALADRVGVNPLELFPYLMAAVLRIESRLGLEGNFAPSPRMGDPLPILDMFLAVAVLVYIAVHYRFLSVTRNLFPLDRRRRLRRPDAARPGRMVLGPVLEQKRSPGLVESQEVGPLILLASVCVFLGQLLWMWVSARSFVTDPFRGRRFPIIPAALWQLAVLLWLFSLFLIVAAGVIAYLGQRRLTANEAGLYLQDELWRQTRRDQSRINRWLAWATRKEKLRQAGPVRETKPSPQKPS